MSFLTMEPSNQTFKALMSNGAKYHVPRFQRDYSWSQTQWEDLWEDIENSHEEEHYMGYIVLQRSAKNKNEFSVIDGQQRLITLSLLVLAAMKKLKYLIDANNETEDNTQRLNDMRRDFIGRLSPGILTPYNKLILNRNNHNKFTLITENLEFLLSRGLTKTDRLISDCFKFFYQKITQDSGIEIVNFIEKITDSMLFTKIVVDNDLNAYKVFETLNARGVQLSTPDLLKNYLFSQVVSNKTVDDNDLEAMDNKWGGIIQELGEENFTDFVRYFHNTRYPLTTKKKLFSSIRDKIQKSKKAGQYLEKLSKYAPIYAALNEANDALWNNEHYRDIVPYLKAFKLFNIKQPFLLLLTAYDKFSADEFIKLAKYLYILSIRYSVITHRSPNKLDKVYNTLAIKISSQEFSRASHIKNQSEFRNLYPDDQAFQGIFEYHTMPSRQSSKKIRFLLTQIENHLSNNTDQHTNWSLEHVTPYNITSEWVQYYDGSYQQDTDRLGNMTLLTKLDNNKCGTKIFEDKKPIYSASSSKLSNKISSYSEWSSEMLNNHQHWLAQQAVETWRINYE